MANIFDDLENLINNVKKDATSSEINSYQDLGIPVDDLEKLKQRIQTIKPLIEIAQKLGMSESDLDNMKQEIFRVAFIVLPNESFAPLATKFEVDTEMDGLPESAKRQAGVEFELVKSVDSKKFAFLLNECGIEIDEYQYGKSPYMCIIKNEEKSIMVVTPSYCLKRL